jgi:uncharacterized protein (TIGR02118 family)
MAKLIALFSPPEDQEAFDAHFLHRHLPLVGRLPGLRGVETSTGPVMSPGAVGAYHKIGIFEFDSILDLQEALASPQGEATGADLANFAGAGVTLLVFETEKV